MPPLDDPYGDQARSIQVFGDRWELITPSDSADLPKKYKYVVCGATGGAVAVLDATGAAATLWAVAGQPLAFRPTRIKATGTDATPLYGVP